MYLREKMTKLRENCSIPEYLQGLRYVADELAIFNSLVIEEELVIHVLNGVDAEYREICVGFCTRYLAINFKELLEKLVSYEIILSHHQIANDNSIISTAFYVNRGQQPHISRPRNQNNNYHRSDNNQDRISIGEIIHHSTINPIRKIVPFVNSVEIWPHRKNLLKNS